MKIIDLLNKIANGEEVPKYIRYRDISKNEYNIMLVCVANIIYQIDQCVLSLNDEVEIIEDKTPQETIKQISKMIASGKIPKDIYDEYLSNCPIGFMNENELVDFLLEREVIDEVNRLKNRDK